MTTLLLGFDGPRFLLLTLAGERPLLLECPPEFRVAISDDEDAATPHHTSTMPPPPPLPLVKARLRIDPNHVWQDDPPPPSERERSPDVQLDPRTLFKNKKKPVPTALVPRPRSEDAKLVQAADEATHDHLIVPGNPGFRASDQGIKAVLTYLRNTQILVPQIQRTVGDDTFIELGPDAFAHLAFTEGVAPTGAPAMLEGTLWFGPKPTALPFGDAARTSLFWLKLKGCRYARVSAQFVARLQQILYLRPEVLTAPHDPARLRIKNPRAATGIPRFDMQETS